MTRRAWLFVAAVLPGLGACDSGGMSTTEVRQAAIERARQQLALGPDNKLEARVWTGRPRDDEITYCGTVSSEGSAAPQIPPQRFAARGDPLQFLVFENAHAPMVTSEPDKFVSWEQLCAGTQAT